MKRILLEQDCMQEIHFTRFAGLTDPSILGEVAFFMDHATEKSPFRPLS